MRNWLEQPARPRPWQFAGVALVVVLQHCTDASTGLPVADVRKSALNANVTSTWTATILALPKGAETSTADDVNDDGVVVGSVTIMATPGPHAVRWKKGHPKYLDEPVGPASATVATAVNNSGIAVGFWNPGIGENEAVFWKANGKVTVLAGLAGGSSDWAFGVNDAGVIVGQSQNHAVRWVDGGVEDLHPPAYGKSRAININSAGDIVGWVEYVTGEHRAYLWHADGSQQELGVLPGDLHSEAMAVNDAVTAVGSSGPLLSSSRAFRWTDATGITDAQLGVAKTVGADIGGSGRIVGYHEFVLNNQSQAIALTRLGSVLDTLPNPLGVLGRAQGVNLCGTVVGTVDGATQGSARAVVWTKPGCDP